LKGVDIILVSSLTYGRGRLNVEAKFVYVETGEMGNAISQVMNPEVPEDMEKSCKTLAENLTGVSSSRLSSSNNSSNNSSHTSTTVGQQQKEKQKMVVYIDGEYDENIKEQIGIKLLNILRYDYEVWTLNKKLVLEKMKDYPTNFSSLKFGVDDMRILSIIGLTHGYGALMMIIDICPKTLCKRSNSYSTHYQSDNAYFD
jgi:hypothetical protein